MRRGSTDSQQHGDMACLSGDVTVIYQDQTQIHTDVTSDCEAACICKKPQQLRV